MIADLKPYAEYKESGVPWLGQIPAHWDLRKLKFLVSTVGVRSNQHGVRRWIMQHIETGTTTGDCPYISEIKPCFRRGRPPCLSKICCLHFLSLFCQIERTQNTEGDNPPVGIILTRHKDELLVEYATYGMSSQLFVQKYQLYLPNRDELRRILEDTLQETDNESITP